MVQIRIQSFTCQLGQSRPTASTVSWGRKQFKRWQRCRSWTVSRMTLIETRSHLLIRLSYSPTVILWCTRHAQQRCFVSMFCIDVSCHSRGVSFTPGESPPTRESQGGWTDVATLLLMVHWMGDLKSARQGCGDLLGQCPPQLADVCMGCGCVRPWASRANTFCLRPSYKSGQRLLPSWGGKVRSSPSQESAQGGDLQHSFFQEKVE